MWTACIEDPQKRLTVVVVALGGLRISATQDHVFEESGIGRVAPEEAGDDLRRQRVGAHTRQAPLFREVEG
jgi:hypothetical protein